MCVQDLPQTEKEILYLTDKSRAFKASSAIKTHLKKEAIFCMCP